MDGGIRYSLVTPAQAGAQTGPIGQNEFFVWDWAPACAGVTGWKNLNRSAAVK